MKKPLDFFGPVLVTGLILYILIEILKFEPMTAACIAVGLMIVFVVGAFLLLFVSARYTGRFAKKINPFMIKYQEDGDVQAYFDGIKPFEKSAYTRACKNAIAVNKLSILYEEEMWEDCLQEVDRYESFAKTQGEKQYALEVRRLCYQGMGDRIREMEIKRQLNDMKAKYGDLEDRDVNSKNGKKTVTAYECKKAMISWFIWTAIFFVGMFAGAILPGIYNGIIVACLFFGVVSFIIGVVYLIQWLVRRRNEAPLDL